MDADDYFGTDGVIGVTGCSRDYPNACKLYLLELDYDRDVPSLTDRLRVLHAHQITFPDPVADGGDMWPTISPNGELVAWTRTHRIAPTPGGGVTSVWIGRLFQLQPFGSPRWGDPVIYVQGAVRVADNARFPHFPADDRLMYTQDDPAGGLSRVDQVDVFALAWPSPLSVGPPVVVVSSPGGDVSDPYTPRDGSTTPPTTVTFREQDYESPTPSQITVFAATGDASGADREQVRALVGDAASVPPVQELIPLENTGHSAFMRGGTAVSSENNRQAKIYEFRQPGGGTGDWSDQSSFGADQVYDLQVSGLGWDAAFAATLNVASDPSFRTAPYSVARCTAAVPIGMPYGEYARDTDLYLVSVMCLAFCDPRAKEPTSGPEDFPMSEGQQYYVCGGGDTTTKFSRVFLLDRHSGAVEYVDITAALEDHLGWTRFTMESCTVTADWSR